MLPLVTAVCVTRNRRQWVQRSIGYFLSQTYPNKELLIVADGESVVDLIPSDERIRLVEFDGTIGHKRNVGAGLSRGSIIAHWDDDDYSAPGRLQQQAQRILSSTKAVTGYSSMFFTDGVKWWFYRHSEPFALGTSICYRKDWWLNHKFESLQIAEDGAFRQVAADADQLSSCPADAMMVASIHPGNTSQRPLSGGSYRPVDAPIGIGSPFR